MDLTMIDVTRIPQAKVGDRVLLLGQEQQSAQGSSAPTTVHVSAQDHARGANTIPYEILTSVGKRVPRVPRSA
jgi:alanine racemase